MSCCLQAVSNATMATALAHCISHPRELVVKVYHFEIITVDASRGVTGHNRSHRSNHQSQGGKDDANQFQSALVCHCKASLRAKKSPVGIPSRASPSLSQFRLVNNTKKIVSEATDNDHGRDGPKQQNWHVCSSSSSAALFINAG